MDVYVLRQALASFACLMECFGCGTIIVFTSTLFVQLEEDPEDIPITKQDESWIASSAILTMSLGSILGGILMHKLRQRKLILIMSSLLRMLGYTMMYRARTPSDLIWARSLTGLTMGISRPVIVSLIGETSEPKLRQFFMNVVPLGTVLGGLSSDLMGAYFHWSSNAFLCILYPWIIILVVILLPEPYGMHIRDDLGKASDSFYWYRGESLETVEEFAKIRIRENEDVVEEFSWRLVLDGKFFKAFLICTLFFATAQVTGMNAMLSYANLIYKDMFPSIDCNTIVIYLDIFRFFLSVSCSFFLKRYKVRHLTLSSIIGVFLSLMTLFVMNYLSEEENLNPDLPGYLQRETVINYCTIFALFSYSVSLFLGLCTLIWSLPTELFDSAARGFGGGATIFVNYFIEFLVVKFTPSLFSYGYSTMFLVFAIATAILGSLLLSVLPETKDKSLVDAQECLLGEKIGSGSSTRFAKFDIMEDSLRYKRCDRI